MGLNVLLVDDSRTVRDVIARTLGLARIPVNRLFEAANGLEALDILERHWIDLVFADLIMPVMNGTTLVGRMQEDGLLRTVPVVVVSTEGSRARLERLQERGVRACLRKPFTPERLRDVVMEVLGLAEQPEKEELLRGVFCEILENFVFVLAEPVRKEDQGREPEGCLTARIRFSGPCHGWALMALPCSLARLMAANALGLEPEDPKAGERMQDALGELLSIACGHLLTSSRGGAGDFDLETPETGFLEPGSWANLVTSPYTQLFAVEGAPILLQFAVQGTEA